MGANFKDLAYLKVSDVQDGRVRYSRAKTQHKFDIQIPAALVPILKRYADAERSNDMLFPIVKRITSEEQVKDIEWARKRYNTALKELAVLAKVNTNLTSYVSRHSFATIALGKASVFEISDMLGHKDIKTTQTYLASLTSEKRDKVHSAIVDI